MVQLAIEIGIDNVRAVIKQGREYNIVPLGLIGSPYSCPPICLKIGEKYVFGEAAKLNAVSRPTETVFLSDYTQEGSVDKRVFIAFITYVCQRVYATFKLKVTEIAFVVPPCTNNPFIQKYLNECICASGFSPLPVSNPALSFVKANLNVSQGEKICVIDMRDFPSNISIVSRNNHFFNTLGSLELTDLSIKDCESFVEEKLLDVQQIEMEASDVELLACIQNNIATLSQYGMLDLIMGKDAYIPLSSTSDDIIISQTGFQSWFNKKIERAWSHIQTFFQDIKTPVTQVNQVVLLGSLFQSEFVCDRFKSCFIAYGYNSKFSIFSKPDDDWTVCLSSLKTNVQTSNFDFAL